MSVKIMARVWEDAPYEGGKLLVLLALADWANDEGFAWPGMERLARKARLEVRQTRTLVRDLESEGMIAIQTGGGRGKQNVYQVTVQKLPSLMDGETRQSDAQTRQFDAETRQPSASDPLVEPLVEPSHSRAREDAGVVFNPERSAVLAKRPKPPTPARSRDRRQSKVAAPVGQPFDPAVKVDVRPAIAILISMGLCVPREDIKFAIDQWRRSRVKSGKIVVDHQEDFHDFLRSYAHNHWRYQYAPKSSDVPDAPGDTSWVPFNYHYWTSTDQRQWAKDYKQILVAFEDAK